MQLDQHTSDTANEKIVRLLSLRPRVALRQVKDPIQRRYVEAVIMNRRMAAHPKMLELAIEALRNGIG